MKLVSYLEGSVAFHWQSGAKDGFVAGILVVGFLVLKVVPLYGGAWSPVGVWIRVMLAFLVPFLFFVLVNGFRDPAEPRLPFWKRLKR